MSDWKLKILNEHPPEGVTLIIHFMYGYPPKIGFYKLRKRLFRKAKYVWVCDEGDQLDESVISHWKLYEPPR